MKSKSRRMSADVLDCRNKVKRSTGTIPGTSDVYNAPPFDAL